MSLNLENFGTDVPVGLAPSRRHRVFDMLYFEGPLTTLFKGKDNTFIVYHWCESDTHVNRWYATTITLESLLRYLSDNIGLRQLLLTGTTAYLVDIGREKGPDDLLKVVRVQMFNPADGVPEGYMPTESANFDPDLARWENQ